MRDAFVESLMRSAAADPRVMLLTADLGFGVLDGFAHQFPKQYLNVGVAEQNMTGIATGMALDGRIVFTYSIANFPTLRCLEQIRNDACYHDANVKIVAIGGGFSYGPLGMSHHATEDLAILRAIPNLTVIAPADDWEARSATTAVVSTPGTCYLRIDRASAPATASPTDVYQVGRARVARPGDDVVLICAGGILASALEAADLLATEQINCRVLSMHTIKPLDIEAIAAAARDTGGIVTVEEHGLVGGLGSAVAEACMDHGLAPRTFYRVALRDGFATAVGSQNYLRARYAIDAVSIARQTARALTRHRRPVRA
jgi:transketolase